MYLTPECLIISQAECIKISYNLAKLWETQYLFHDLFCPHISHHSVWSVITAHKLMPSFHHSVAVLPLPFRRSAVVKLRCSVKIA